MMNLTTAMMGLLFDKKRCALSTGKRLVVGILAAVIVMLSGNPYSFAADKKLPAATAGASADAMPNDTFVVFIFANPEYHDLAVGMSLFITDQIRRYQGAPIRPFTSLWDAAVRNNLLETAQKKILVDNLPIAALEAQARMVLVGELSSKQGEFTLVLRLHDGVTGALINETTITAPAHDIMLIMGKAINAIDDLTKIGFTKQQIDNEDMKVDLSGIVALGRAFALLKEGKSSQALDVLKKAEALGLKISPKMLDEEFLSTLRELNDPYTKVWQAEFMGTAQLALKQYEALLGKNNRDFNSLLRRAELFIKQREFKKARQDIDKAIKLQPSDNRSYALMAQWYHAQNNSVQALKYAQKAIVLGSVDPDIYIMAGDLFLAQGKKQNAAAMYHKAGQLLLNRGSIAEANEIFIKALEVDPKQVDVGEMPLTFLDEQQRSKVKAALQSRISENPDDPDYYRQLGQIEMQAGDVSGAEKHLRGSYFLNKDDPKTNMLLGELYLNDKKDLDQAIRHFQSVKRETPDDPTVSLRLAQVNEKAEFNERAREYYSEYLRQNPKDKQAMKSLAQQYLKQGKVNEAIGLYERIVSQLDPDDAEANMKLSELYLRQGRTGKANSIKSKIKKLTIKLSDDAKEDIKDLTGGNKDGNLAGEKKLPTKSGGVFKKSKLLFPDMLKVVQEFEGGVSEVAVIDLPSLKKENALLERLTSFNIMDSKIIADQLCRSFSVNYATHCGPAVDKAVGPQLAEAFNPPRFDEKAFNAFVQAARTLGAESIATFTLTQLPSKEIGQDVFQVDIYFFRMGYQELQTEKVILNKNTEGIISFNFFILVGPLVLIGLIGLIIGMFMLRGFGSLIVHVAYDSRFEQGYFGVRLSKRKLSEAFNVKNAMKAKFDGDTHIDTSEVMKKIFTSWSPLIQSVKQNKAIFKKIPTGKYYVYLTGIMVNIENGEPIGNYEIERQIVIKRDEKQEMNINLEVTEAFVEIQVKLQGKVAEGAEVIIDGNENMRQIVEEGKEISMYLSLGEHTIFARYEDFEANALLHFDDSAPKIVELHLYPRGMAPSIEQQAVISTSGHRGLSEGGEAVEDGQPAVVGAIDSGYKSMADLFTETKEDTGTGLIQSNEFEPTYQGSSPRDFSLDDFSVDPATASSASLMGGESAKAVSMDDAMIDDLFAPHDEVTGQVTAAELSDPDKEKIIKNAHILMQKRKYEDAVDLFLQAGDYDSAAAACQQTGNQALNYKIYGLAYMETGNFRDAAEMFKYAGEVLLQADALERMRMHEEANMLRGNFYMEQGEADKALDFYQKASAHDKVGEILAGNGKMPEAGEAFFKARKYLEAAECFTHAQLMDRAAESYEMAGEFKRAAELFAGLGANVRAFQNMEKAGEYLRAAEGYKKVGMLDQAINACQQIPSQNKDFLRGVVLQGKIFKEKNELDMMHNLYEAAAEEFTVTMDNLNDIYTLAVVAQDDGALVGAYKLYEKIQQVHYNYADVGDRAKLLKTQVAQMMVRGPVMDSLMSGDGTMLLSGETVAGQTLPGKEGRYVVIEELGRGAMGVVWKSKDTLLERIVAYKTLSSAIRNHPAAVKYFMSEAKSLAALNHPNIVTVYDIGQEGNTYYIVMEYVAGMTLADFIAEKGKLSIRNALIIAGKIASGLAYAHERRVVHRDIKPSNIMISSTGEVKIMDFGLAKIIDDAMQDKTMARGTPLYMAPEQIRGDQVDNRVDIYALGVTMFEMVTGTPPFTTGEITYHHLHTEPPKPTDLNPSIPEALEKIILQCMSKDRDNRFQDAEMIKAALKPLQSALKG